MKHNIDLTLNRDFDPNKFKVKKVQSTYYDNNGNKSKLPWDKKGTLFNNHTLRYQLYDEDGIIYYFDRNNAFWSNTSTWTSSINFTTINANGVSYNMLSTWDDDIFRWDIPPYTYASIYDGYTHFISSSTVSTNASPNTIIIKPNIYTTGFRTGSVKNMRLVMARPMISNRYKDLYKDVKREIGSAKKYNENYMYHKKASSILHNLFGKNKSRRCVYTGYESFIDEYSISEYKHMNNYDRRRSDYPICEILDNYKRWVPCIYKKVKPYNRFTNNKDYSKVRWVDFHNDYLREIQGRQPMNDWRHGNVSENNFKFRPFSEFEEDGIYV